MCPARIADCCAALCCTLGNSGDLEWDREVVPTFAFVLTSVGDKLPSLQHAGRAETAMRRLLVHWLQQHAVPVSSACQIARI